MLYTTLEVHGEEYKLRLTNQGIAEVEKRIGRNPLMVLFDFYSVILEVQNSKENLSEEESQAQLMVLLYSKFKVSEFAEILRASLQKYHHGFTLENTYQLLDDMDAEGKDIQFKFTLLTEIFQNSGLIPKEDNKKN